jgi:protein-tyrosine phosphatase
MTVGGPQRLVELESCCNFRDLGGYPTADGRRTRWRRLFRADGLTQLSDGDRSVLRSLGVRIVIDLRTGLEVESRGRFPEDVGGVAYHHLPLTDTLPGAEDVPDWGEPTFVARRYASYLEAGAESLGTALDLLGEAANLPAVFHCSVGKDRTGVLAAVVLGLVGVPDEVIVEDYVLSALAMSRILERLRGEYPDAADTVARFAPVILSVEPASMEGFLGAVHARFGSFPAMAEAMGRTAAVERLRHSLLEPA